MTMPWDGMIPQDDIAAMEKRGSPQDREPKFGSRPALIVVDKTRHFAHPGYTSSCYETGGDEAVKATVSLLETARAAGIKIIFIKAVEAIPETRLPHELGRKLARHPELFQAPSDLPPGNVIADELGPRMDEGEMIVAKPKPSAFYGTPLDMYLNLYSIDTVIVCGMATSGCVRATVIDADMRNHRVVVPFECTADYSWFQHKTSLFDMHMKYADVAGVKVVQDYLSTIPKPVY